MSWRAFLTQRTAVPGLKPVSLSWNAIGGPSQAVLSLEDELVGFETMRGWLGSGVEVYDPSDRLAWWGFVERVCQPMEKTAVESSLESFANRIAVRYRTMEPGRDYGAELQTPWKDDLASQAVYGVRELLIQRDQMSEQQALRLRDMSLNRLAQPARKLLPNTKLKHSQVFCRGWFERLAWRQWLPHSDVLGHSPVQQGSQPVGAVLSQRSLAQSCAVSEAVKISSRSVRARKIGFPTDQIRFQIQSDALGQPSGVVRAEAALAASEVPTDGFGWISAWFASPCAVESGERVWLVAARDGSPSSTAYCSLGLDETLGFPDGKMLIWDASLNQWKPRNPDADLLFKLTSLSDSVDLMERMVQQAGCFSGFSFEAGQGFSLPYVSQTGANCQAAFLDLLRMGTPGFENLLVEVSPGRHLRVFPQPQPSSSRFWLGKDGRINNETGGRLEPAWQAVGSWLTSETGTACFLDNLRLDVSDNNFQIGTDSAG